MLHSGVRAGGASRPSGRLASLRRRETHRLAARGRAAGAARGGRGCVLLGAGAAARAPGSAAGGGPTNDLLLFVAVSANLHAPTRTDPAAEK